jgi:glutaredoxin
MVHSRKQKVLALSAILLVVVFVFIATHRDTKSSYPVAGKKTAETTSRIGDIDEGAIKSNEDKIKQKLAESQDAAIKGKTNQELKKQQGVKDDPQSVDVAFDVEKEFQSIMGLSPIVMFSKTYCGFSKALRNLLTSEYEISPPPTIVELDKHKKGAELQEYIASKTGRKTVPNLFVNGVSRGGSDEMRKLHDEGKLLSSLNQWGGKNVKTTKINAPSNS